MDELRQAAGQIAQQSRRTLEDSFWGDQVFFKENELKMSNEKLSFLSVITKLEEEVKILQEAVQCLSGFREVLLGKDPQTPNPPGEVLKPEAVLDRLRQVDLDLDAEIANLQTELAKIAEVL